MIFISEPEFYSHIGRAALSLVEEINTTYTDKAIILLEANSYSIEDDWIYVEVAYDILEHNQCLYIAFMYHPNNKEEIVIDEFYETDQETALKYVRSNDQ